MASLALPPPVNGTNGSVSPSPSPNPALSSSVILPPPEIRAIVDKTASFVSKNANPESFEEKIRAREKSDSRFAFLNKADAYHAYYQLRLDAFRNGETLDATTTAGGAATGTSNAANGATTQHKDEAEDGVPPQPPALEFLVDNPPPMNAVDLDIIRLTALFTARSGRRFASELAARETRNYQFDFLRPSHSLFGYFNRLVEQYTKILIPSKEFHAQIDRRAGGPVTIPPEERVSTAKKSILEDARKRVEWEKYENSKRQEAEDKAEQERIAFAEIDWQDFIVVSTVEFTEQDESGLTELPAPMSLSEVENMSIAQKKMATMIMEGREDEIEDPNKQDGAGGDDEMELSDEDEDRERLKPVEIVQVKNDANGPIKIRKDYVPKAKREKKDKEQAYTTFGGQQVPVDEFADHVRIELLDPKWKETKRQNEANRSAANLLPGGTDVAASLKNLAQHRSDIFGQADDEAIKKQQEEARILSKAREAGVWDGHTATKDSILDRYQKSANLDEQIQALHRAKGLVGDDATSKIGPAAVPTEPVIEGPAPSFIKAGAATISSAPKPQDFSNPYAAGQYGQGYGIAQYGQPLSAVPTTSDATASTSTAVTGDGTEATSGTGTGTGTTRRAEDELEGEPSAKRQKATPKLAEGQYYPEEEWIASHPEPISLKIQLPSYPQKPEWGCSGETIDLVEVPLTALIGSLRDRVSIKVGLPIGKQKLTFKGRILANNATLAGLNFEDGDLIDVSIKETKKK